MADLNPPEIPRKTYRGSCHCGAVEFDVVHPDVETAGVSLCNCTLVFPNERFDGEG